MTQEQYEDRIVCFLDILGFKELVDSTIDSGGEEEASKTQAMSQALLSIRDVLDVDKGHISKSKRVTQFSDSVVISFQADEPSEVFFTILELLWTQARLVYHGMLLRGGIAVGKLCHTDKLVFGPALVEAYLLESKIAQYPRIVVSEAVIEKGARHSAVHHDVCQEREAIENCLALDADGHMFVDYFEKAQSELDDPQLDFPEYMMRMRSMIERGLRAKTPSVVAKHEWMRSKFNPLARACSDPEFLDGLDDSDIADAYAAIDEV